VLEARSVAAVVASPRLAAAWLGRSRSAVQCAPWTVYASGGIGAILLLTAVVRLWRR
jgi:hypothetical protein